MKKYLLFICLNIVIATIAFAGAGRPHGNLYSIAIGINKYKTKGLSFNNCVKDAKLFTQKIEHHNGIGVPDSLSGVRYRVDTTFSYALYDEDASLENIVQTFQDIALRAKSTDVLTLFIAGRTHELRSGGTVFVPFIADSVDFSYSGFNLQVSQVLTLTDLAKLMNQISCYRQLVVSESGYGSLFATSLLVELFEDNPLKASHSVHNRVIITTRYAGLDSYFCGHKLLENGPLLTYMLKCGNPLRAIFSPDYYELDLIRAEVTCPVNNRRYCRLYNEQEYLELLRQRADRNGDEKAKTRGGKNVKTQNDISKPPKIEPPKTYALIIGTNKYLPTSNWSNLANPINDAKSIAELMQTKYGAELHNFYDATIDEVYTGINNLIETCRAEDKLFVFIAGHGYYEHKTKTASLPLSDSKSPENDPRLTTYLKLSDLQQRLDDAVVKNVFIIFDVCFGAQFEPNAHNLSISNYDEELRDIDFETFDKRMNIGKTRIFMASGRYEVPDYWKNSLDHSPFAKKIIHGLKKENEFISPSKLYAYTRANVTQPHLKWFGHHDDQSDFLIPVK